MYALWELRQCELNFCLAHLLLRLHAVPPGVSGPFLNWVIVRDLMLRLNVVHGMPFSLPHEICIPTWIIRLGYTEVDIAFSLSIKMVDLDLELQFVAGVLQYQPLPFTEGI